MSTNSEPVSGGGAISDEWRRSSGASPNIEHELSACEHALAEALGEVDVLRVAADAAEARAEAAEQERDVETVRAEAWRVKAERADAVVAAARKCADHPSGIFGASMPENDALFDALAAYEKSQPPGKMAE